MQIYIYICRKFIARYRAYLCVTLFEDAGGNSALLPEFEAAISQCVKQAIRILDTFGTSDGISLATLRYVCVCTYMVPNIDRRKHHAL